MHPYECVTGPLVSLHEKSDTMKSCARSLNGAYCCQRRCFPVMWGKLLFHPLGHGPRAFALSFRIKTAAALSTSTNSFSAPRSLFHAVILSAPCITEMQLLHFEVCGLWKTSAYWSRTEGGFVPPTFLSSDVTEELNESFFVLWLALALKCCRILLFTQDLPD